MKILITDDHKIVRDGLKEILGHIPSIKLIDEAKDGNEALDRLSSGSYNMVLLDISLPDINGIRLLETIMNKYPSQKVLMLSMHPQEPYAIRALKLGASGYLTKDTASEELIEAVKRISGGGKYISASLAHNIASHFDKDYSGPPHEMLSEREFDIMIRIANGQALNEIGAELFISGKTVSTYRSRLMTKMGFKNNAEVTRYCIDNGLL